MLVVCLFISDIITSLGFERQVVVAHALLYLWISCVKLINEFCAIDVEQDPSLVVGPHPSGHLFVIHVGVFARHTPELGYHVGFHYSEYSSWSI